MAYILAVDKEETWEIAPCAGVDGEVRAWLEEFSAVLGLTSEGVPPGRRILLGRARRGPNSDVAIRSKFFPPLPADLPEEGLRIWGAGGVLLFMHPASRDVFCGLYPVSGPSVVDQMSHALIPVLEGTVATGGIPLHGALIERRGAGVVLLGRSGAGKTTCCRRLPPGWNVYGDDLSLALPDGKVGFRVHPLPTWSSVKLKEVHWPCRVHRSVPLRALFLLEQSDRCDATPLDTALSAVVVNRAARQALIAHGFRNYRRSREFTSRVFATSVLLAKAVPAFHLQVSLKGRFWEQIEERMEGLVSPLNVPCSEPGYARESRI